MKRWYIHCYAAGDKSGFPANTYCTDEPSMVVACIDTVVRHPNGIERIEIQDSTLMLPLHTMAPWDLDDPRVVPHLVDSGEEL